MDFTQLRYFNEVARAGSIRKASERLHVAASALSRHIQNLEHQLGTPLFERHTGGMRLTAAGEIYAHHAKLVMMDAERTRAELAALRGLRRGSVRLAVVEGAIEGYLMDALGDFRALHPGVTAEVRALGTHDVLAAVRDGDADIGIAFNARPEPPVEFLFYIADQVCAVCPPGHPLTRAKRVSLRDAMDYPLAVPVTGFGIRALIDECCRIGRMPLVPALECNNIGALRAFARAGLGVALITVMSCRRDTAAGELAAIELAEPALRGSSIDVLVLAGRTLPAAAAAFLDHLRARAVNHAGSHGRAHA